MSKAEAKAAGKIGSEKFEELRQYMNEFPGFEIQIKAPAKRKVELKVYFQRMSAKMVQKVFKAFWKFTFIKTAEDGEVYPKDRYINHKTLEAMLNKYHYELCEYIEQNKSYFTISEDSACMAHACVLLAYYPQIYIQPFGDGVEVLLVGTQGFVLYASGSSRREKKIKILGNRGFLNISHGYSCHNYTS